MITREHDIKIRQWVQVTWLLGPGVFSLQEWLQIGLNERETILEEALSLGKR